MTEQVREHYFLAMRMCIVLVLEIYILFTKESVAGPSSKVVLLLALFLGALILKSVLPKKYRIFMFLVMGAVLCYLDYSQGGKFILLNIFFLYEVISFCKMHLFLYFIPLLCVFIPGQKDNVMTFVLTLFLGMIYIQHNYIVVSYRTEKKEDNKTEQMLKQDMFNRQMLFEEQLNRSLLQAENKVLDEKAKLAQTLHDQLGHSINGSIYQLEATKVLLEQKPDNAKERIQAVIDQLREGMDEIRAILRNEKPQKYKLAMIQLQQLCEECSKSSVKAELDIKGDLADVPDRYLEILLDNLFEGVTNALKYSKCTRINLMIHVMNQMVRCSISDNGVGCSDFVDGMGIAGMRRRMRNINGVLDFETTMGFTINMLLPLE